VAASSENLKANSNGESWQQKQLAKWRRKSALSSSNRDNSESNEITNGGVIMK
jgi:hypothetical protein